MGDNRSTPCPTPPARTIAGFEADCTRVALGADAIAFWRVADLERHVDRDALLRADDPPEPPYWAYCWSGARVLAERVPASPGRVLEVGCGLGLPGVAAARRGGEVVFVDRMDTPLAFVRASLASNGLAASGLVVADLCAPAWGRRFDLVLAAEVLYDRAAFGAVAAAFARTVTPAGRVLLADGHRIDTAAFYDAAAAAGFTWTREDVRVDEEGLPHVVSVVTMRLR